MRKSIAEQIQARREQTRKKFHGSPGDPNYPHGEGGDRGPLSDRAMDEESGAYSDSVLKNWPKELQPYGTKIERGWRAGYMSGEGDIDKAAKAYADRVLTNNDPQTVWGATERAFKAGVRRSRRTMI